MVILFLGDKRAALIVILTIPISIISGVLFLKLFGQTINLMSLSGLALAIGILVDESTVTIENIHQHFDMGKPKALAIWHACTEIALPKLLILLCILAVFAPAFTMAGIPGALFLPLALAVGFSMVVSFLLSQTFVPVMANWIMKTHGNEEAHGQNPENYIHKDDFAEREDYDVDGKVKGFDKFRLGFMKLIDRLLPSAGL
jgi:multidrug efflux pump subunit AcrB